MSLLRETQRLFRDREGERSERVTFVELFFDLVFVFAVTQLSHTLIDHLTPLGALQTGVLLIAVWWVWMYTTWVTNWMDPETGVVRGMLIALMLLGLVLSTSIPTAFGERSLLFAGAYVVMQVSRTALVALAYVRVDRSYAGNLARILIWFVATAPLWIVGAALGGITQLVLWIAAVLIEVCGPAARYFVPGIGRSDVNTWDVSGNHMAERSGLFIIIALGESILVTGTAVSELGPSPTSVSAFLAAFSGTILLWLLYFGHGAEGGSRFISQAERAGPIARLSYVYLHIPIIAGIVVIAVGDELVLEHPSGEVEFAANATITLGAALYLMGVLLFKRSVGAPWLISHLVGIAAVVILFVVPIVAPSPWLDSLVLTWSVNAVLAVIVLIEETAIRRRAADPSAPDEPGYAEDGPILEE